MSDYKEGPPPQVNYVCGFYFSFEVERVLLIRKMKPAWQRGSCNGLGGKIEHGESPSQAMRREFFEESELQTLESGWKEYAYLHGLNGGREEGGPYGVHFFAYHGQLTASELAEVANQHWHKFVKMPGEFESLTVVSVHELRYRRVLPNLKWLVPMAYNILKGDDACTMFDVHEQQYR
jgi:8-oxo-dGTP pyrophosphatase MutT (NUDIX family)